MMNVVRASLCRRSNKAALDLDVIILFYDIKVYKSCLRFLARIAYDTVSSESPLANYDELNIPDATTGAISHHTVFRHLFQRSSSCSFETGITLLIALQHNCGVKIFNGATYASCIVTRRPRDLFLEKYLPSVIRAKLELLPSQATIVSPLVTTEVHE